MNTHAHTYPWQISNGHVCICVCVCIYIYFVHTYRKEGHKIYTKAIIWCCCCCVCCCLSSFVLSFSRSLSILYGRKNLIEKKGHTKISPLCAIHAHSRSHFFLVSVCSAYNRKVKAKIEVYFFGLFAWFACVFVLFLLVCGFYLFMSVYLTECPKKLFASPWKYHLQIEGLRRLLADRWLQIAPISCKIDEFNVLCVIYRIIHAFRCK